MPPINCRLKLNLWRKYKNLMKKKEFIQIKGLDLKELKDKVKALKAELVNLVMDKNMKKLKDLKMISKKKKEIAQILTLMKQKEILQELESKVEEKEGKK